MITKTKMKLTTKTKNIIEKVSGIVLLTVIAVFLLWLIFQAHFSAGYETGIKMLTEDTTRDQPEQVEGWLVPDNSYQLEMTGFSSCECKTTWCRANAGKPRDQQVALNPRYGEWSEVYIPVYGKTYKVIGTTDNNTDLDIWFGDECQLAKDFGRKTLLVHLIK